MNYSKLLKNYDFDAKDRENLKSVYSLITTKVEDLKEEFYTRIFRFEHAKKFLGKEEILLRHKEKISLWYIKLFSGVYDDAYFKFLENISSVHVRIGLNHHYVNAAFNAVRSFTIGALLKEGKEEIIASFEKILDINLDILSGSYSHTEQDNLLSSVELIHSALKDEKLITPFVQPIVDAQTLKVQKYESLIRLKNEKAEPVSPFFFLETAYKTGLYNELSQKMIGKTLNLFSQTEDEFSLNISYLDVKKQSNREKLLELLQSFKDPQRVTFEVLESDILEDKDLILEFIKEIRALGCKVAIDDFGSGFSNYDNVLLLNPDFLKIDGSLIKELENNSKLEAVVESITSLAKRLEIKSVAEFVHNKKVLEKVQQLGVDYVQGYYIAEPFDAENLLEGKRKN